MKRRLYHAERCSKFTHQALSNVAPRSHLDTPKTWLIYTTHTDAGIKSVSIPSIFCPENHLQHKITVIILRSGVWKFVVSLSCHVSRRKCRWLHHHGTWSLGPRVKYWEAIRLSVSNLTVVLTSLWHGSRLIYTLISCIQLLLWRYGTIVASLGV